MNLTQFFAKLGAPLKNSRWSWGGVRQHDNTVFLRVWEDRITERDGSCYMQLSHLEKYGEGRGNLGYMERLDHIQRIDAGAKCYMVICVAKDPIGTPREILDFKKDYLFLGGKPTRDEYGNWIIEIKDKYVPVNSVT